MPNQDRTEYMKFYMRAYRAEKRAARLAAESGNTEPDSEESTEGGGSWLFWLVVGVALAAVVVGSIRNGKAVSEERKEETNEQ